jgi:integrase
MTHLNAVPTVLEFTESNYKRIWDKPEHQLESLGKITAFSKCMDYSERLITEYRPAHIYDFLEHREEMLGNSPATLNRYMAALSKVFKYYDDEFRADITPRLKWRKEGGGRPRYFTVAEQAQLKEILTNSPNPWAWDFVVLGLKSGMRKGEILGIGRSKQQVKPNKPYGKIAEDYSSVHLFQTKNGTERVVPLHREAVTSLKAMESEPSKVYDHHKFYREWGRARDVIAFDDETFVFHVTRHTAATTLASLGFNTVQIGRMLGHKSLQTTMKYIHESDESSVNMINSL